LFCELATSSLPGIFPYLSEHPLSFAKTMYVFCTRESRQ
jgi:hypothetical protein